MEGTQVGKVAVLSGATRGLGAKVTLALAARGVRVCLLSHNLEEAGRLVSAIEGRGGSGMVIPCMVEDDDDLRSALRTIRERFDAGIDIMFTNMGMMPPSPDYPRKDVSDLTAGEWDAYMGTALKGVFNSTARAFESMREHGKPGVIVNTALYGLGPSRGLGLYSASRAAILSIVDTVNEESRNDENPVSAYLVDCEDDVRDAEDDVVSLVADLCLGEYRGAAGLVRVGAAQGSAPWSRHANA